MEHLPSKKILGTVRGEGPTVSLTTTEKDTGAKCGQVHSPPVSQALSDNVNLQRCSKVGFTVETHFFSLEKPFALLQDQQTFSKGQDSKYFMKVLI